MQLLLTLSSLAPSSVVGAFSEVGPYPASYAVFSSAFKQPPIPDLATDLHGHFIQHKWYDISRFLPLWL